MQRRRFITQSVLALALCLGMACNQSPDGANPEAATAQPASPEAPVSLTISVATSVQDAMTDIQAAYQEEFPHVSITYNFGSSGSLAQQISQGAPTDVYLSASLKWMDDLENQGVILAGSRQDLLQNAMVLIVAQDNTEINGFEDLNTVQASNVAIGEPESVPAGHYAKEVLTTLNLFDALQSKMVFGKDVRQVLSYVETGNADAGLVYMTDALISDQVKVVTTAPVDSHSPIVYPIAIVNDSENVEAAQNFIDFLSSETAIAIFQDYGFTMAETP
jgi:molybdate transport system substrate-binding protein